ncbi:Cell surface glycoprotein (Predicted) [Balamuthia mandrillaris]
MKCPSCGHDVTPRQTIVRVKDHALGTIIPLRPNEDMAAFFLRIKKVLGADIDLKLTGEELDRFTMLQDPAGTFRYPLSPEVLVTEVCPGQDVPIWELRLTDPFSSSSSSSSSSSYSSSAAASSSSTTTATSTPLSPPSSSSPPPPSSPASPSSLRNKNSKQRSSSPPPSSSSPFQQQQQQTSLMDLLHPSPISNQKQKGGPQVMLRQQIALDDLLCMEDLEEELAREWDEQGPLPPLPSFSVPPTSKSPPVSVPASRGINADNAKNKLQELYQKESLPLPRYNTSQDLGTNNQHLFESEVDIHALADYHDYPIQTTFKATDKTKTGAEKQAALKALTEVFAYLDSVAADKSRAVSSVPSFKHSSSSPAARELKAILSNVSNDQPPQARMNEVYQRCYHTSPFYSYDNVSGETVLTLPDGSATFREPSLNTKPTRLKIAERVLRYWERLVE